MRSHALACRALVALAFFCIGTGAQAADRHATAADGDRAVTGTPVEGAMGIEETVASIMQRQARFPSMLRPPRRSIEHEHRREPLPLPGALEVSRWPVGDAEAGQPYNPVPLAPQTVSTPNFTAATLADTNAFPPDTMGAVGPTQFIVAVNGRIRSFNKTTGAADAALDVSTDVFFASVLTPVAGTFTSDPRIRYDRLSGRWFLVIIDVPNGGASSNRVLVAVSSGATITGTASFTFFQFQMSTTNFTDYPTLGIDANALYIGANMFTTAGAYAGTDAAVVRKSSVLGAGPIVSTVFTGLAVGSGAGPFTPQGVDNFDPAATEGYFVGVDNAVFSLVVLRRVTNPGTTPTLSGNLNLTVPTTTSPNQVTHLGNAGGLNGRLDSLDDRLYAAHLRNGRLWTAHNIRVSSAGVASTAAEARNAVRWYEITSLTTSPALVQSGTVFDGAATLATAQQYWIPSVMVSGQGHAALGFSAAGTNFRVDAATIGRLVTDTLGTTQGAPVRYTSSSFAYNPPSDTGAANGSRRWGDYSYTSVDPCDDQTMWTIQQFTDATNSYGVRAVRLRAPAPTLTACGAPTAVPQGGTANVVVSGTGLFNTSAGIDACRIAASASVDGTGVSVTGVTVNSPTQATVGFSATPTATAGPRTLTFVNPDGQLAATATCVTVTAAASVSSIVLGQASPACAGTNVTWNVSFSTAVTGLSASNFALAGSAVGASIVSVTGSGAAWTVTANPGTASGTLRLDLVNSTGVTPTLAGLPATGATYTISATPAAFAVSGGGAYCSGGAGVAVGLTGSASGVNYQLLRDAVAVGSPVAGTGSALSFGNQTAAGSYTVTATGSGGCTAGMSGSTAVSVNPLPVVNAGTPTAICTGATTAIPLTSTPAGASFTWTAASAGGSVTGFSGGSGTNIAQVLTGAGSVDYVVSASLAGCASASTRTFTQPVSGPQVVQTTLPAAVQGFAYAQQLTATGLLGSATFSRTVGALPAGLALSPAGLIDGTPTAVGPSSFTIAVADSAVAGCSGSRNLGIEVRANQVFVDGFEGP